MRPGFPYLRSVSLLLVWIVLLVLAPGCAQRRFAQDRRPPSRPVAGVSSPLVYRTEVGIGSCLADAHQVHAAMAIPAAVVASLISAGIDYVGAALEEAAKATEDKASAFRNVELARGDVGPCLQIVRGWFYEFATEQERSDVAARAVDWAGPIGETERKLLAERRMWLAAPPDFVFEAQVQTAAFGPPANGTFLTLAPRFAWLREPISHRILRFDKDRDVSVFFGFSPAGEKFGAVEGAGAGIVLGRLDRGVLRTYAPFESDTSKTPDRGTTESPWFGLKVGESKQPMRVSALVVEHQDASAFLGFVAAVFGGAKKELKTTAASALIPSERETARESELSAEETARSAFESALATMRAAAISCASEGDDAMSLAVKVRDSIRKFNAAARADDEDPFEEKLVPLSKDLAVVRNGCGALRAAIDQRF